jgi:hypothetical protein
MEEDVEDMEESVQIIVMEIVYKVNFIIQDIIKIIMSKHAQAFYEKFILKNKIT